MAEQYKIEIEYLKEALAASQKKADRYASLVSSLSDELDSLRSSICLTCKRNLVLSKSTHPPPPATVPSNPPAPVILTPPTTKPLPAVPPTTNPEPMWSVEHNPKLKQSIDLQIAHVLTYDASVYCMKLSPDGQKIAMGLQMNGKTYINDLKSGSIICVLEDLNHRKDNLSIWTIQFSPDSRLLATGSSDHKIRIWDIAQKRVRQLFKSHTKDITRLDFSPTGRFLVSASFDYSVRLWSVRDGSSKKASSKNCFGSAAFHPSGRYIAAGNRDCVVRIWDARTMRLVTRWTGQEHVWCLEFTPDGKGLMCGSTGGVLKYWDVSSLGHKDPVEIRRFERHSPYLQSVAFFRGNSQWVLGGTNRVDVRLWDVALDDWVLTLRGHTDEVKDVGVSRTENYLATASSDCRVTIWKYNVL